LLPAIALLGAALLYGYVRTSDEQGSPVARIALIQGSVDTEIKFDPEMRQLVFEEYLLLSQEAVEKSRPARLDLIVWPETMFRDPLVTFDELPPMPDDFDGTEEEFRQAFRAYAEEAPRLMTQMALALDAPMILGVDRHHYGPQGGVQRLNSAVFVTDHGELLGQYYDKVHLVMFGEYVPFVRHFPSLQRLTPVSISINPGTRATVFELDGGLRIAPSICYETVIPHVIRWQINSLKAEGAEPDVLVNLTNDGWFWGSSELDMHLACGVFRAVECRKPLLIAANTGFSAWIDGDGRILAQGRRYATDILVADVRLDSRQSWYLAHGDWFGGVCLGCCLLLAGVGCWGWRRGSRTAAPAAPRSGADAET
jgi:apolipoprotein N-acyltransferase